MEPSDHRHRGISCDACEANNFSGQRFKCLKCVDFDLCQNCFENDATSLQHKADHPMQCLLTRRDQNMYFAGGPGVFASFTCPMCGANGLGRVGLAEHLEQNHATENSESEENMCPVCILVHRTELRTSDLAAHVRKEHDEQEELVELLKRTQEHAALGGGPQPLTGELAELLRRRPQTASHSRPEERRLASMARLLRATNPAHTPRLEEVGLRDFDEMLRMLGDRENLVLHERDRMHDIIRRSEERERRLRKSSAIIIHQPASGKLIPTVHGDISSGSSDSTESGDGERESSSGKLSSSAGSGEKLPRRPGLLSTLCDEEELAEITSSSEEQMAEQEMRRTFVRQLLLASLCRENTCNLENDSEPDNII